MATGSPSRCGSARLDSTRASTRSSRAFVLDVRNGTDFRRNVRLEGASEGAYWNNEDRRGPSFIFVRQAGPFALRNARHRARRLRTTDVPQASGGDTNEKDLKDLVALGKETFTQIGCEACHLVEKDSAAVSTGPNLFGLFRADARTREVVEGGEGHRFQVKANREYLHRSVREPWSSWQSPRAVRRKASPIYP